MLGIDKHTVSKGCETPHLHHHHYCQSIVTIFVTSSILFPCFVGHLSSVVNLWRSVEFNFSREFLLLLLPFRISSCSTIYQSCCRVALCDLGKNIQTTITLLKLEIFAFSSECQDLSVYLGFTKYIKTL